MRSGSLRLRIFVLAAAAIVAALGLAWVALTYLFERHITARLSTELASQIVWIAANLDITEAGVALHAQPPDPRFSMPFGGLYWQIDVQNAAALRSRSLWDEALPNFDLGLRRSGTSLVQLGSPERQVFVRAEDLTLSATDGEQEIRVSAAVDYSEVQRPVSEFGREMAIALVIIGTCLTVAAGVQTSLGLKPLAMLRRQLTQVRSRQLTRLDPDAPLEVRPLVSEVNELLAAQEDALARARARAGDLAHALKTPLAVLSTIARELEHTSSAKEAEEIVAQVGAMQRRIDRELARARMRTDRFGSADLSGLIKRLVDIMRRTPRGRNLEWTNEVDPDLMVAADEVDAAEAIGNVLENACRWAGSRVAIATRVDSDSIVLTIEDDGSGVPDHKLEEIVRRGTQLNEDGHGAGLGLAIASEILLAYGGGVRPLRSSLGGLRIEMTWPQRHGPLTSHTSWMRRVDR